MDIFKWFKSSKKQETYGRDIDSVLGRAAAAGVVVNEKTALNLVDVFACVRAISETMASLPFPTYQRLDSGGKDRLRQHPVYRALNVSPDGEMPAMQWREAGLAHLLTWGNWFNEIESTYGGELLNLYLLQPNKTKPERTKSGKLEYKVEGSYVRIPADRMLHVAGLGFDGISGYSPIKMGASAIGLAMAAERFGSTWFGNGSRGQGVITYPDKLTDQAKENIRKSLMDVHGGPDNAHRWMIFEEGASISQLGIPPEDAQFLGTRQFQLTEICRLYRISPTIVQDLSRSTFSNGEQESINFVVHTLRPWARRIENEFNRKLFDPDGELFCEHLLDGLLRGDQATRNAAYATGRQWGWYSADDVNELENRNPLPNGQGKIYLVPSNMMNAAKLIEKPEPEPTEPPPEPSQNEPEPVAAESVTDSPSPDQEAVKASLDCVRDNVDRMLRREVEAVRKAASKPKQFLNLVDAFYQQHGQFCQRALAPSLKAFSAVAKVGTVDLTKFVSSSGQDELLELSGTVSAEELPKAVEEWASRRLAKSEEIVASLAI